MKIDCSVNSTIDIISKDWTLLIILELYKGKRKKRYSEIKRSLSNITPKILSLRLKELVKEKLIINEIDSTTIPIKSVYYLSESGRDMIKLIKEIKKWSIKHKPHMKSCESSDCKDCKF